MFPKKVPKSPKRLIVCTWLQESLDELLYKQETSGSRATGLVYVKTNCPYWGDAVSGRRMGTLNLSNDSGVQLRHAKTSLRVQTYQKTWRKPPKDGKTTGQNSPA